MLLLAPVAVKPVPEAAHVNVPIAMVSEPDVKGPDASTVSVTLPPLVVRALTSTLTGAEVYSGVTSGSASANVMDARPSDNFALALTLAVTAIDAVAVCWASAVEDPSKRTAAASRLTLVEELYMTLTTFKVTQPLVFVKRVSAVEPNSSRYCWQITAALCGSVQFCAGLLAECLGGDREHARNAKRLGEVAGNTEVDRLDRARLR